MNKHTIAFILILIVSIPLSFATPTSEEFDSGSTSVLSDAFPQFVESKSVSNGKLIVEPEYTGWYNAQRSSLLYKDVTGNFVVETDVYTEDGYPGDPKPPSNVWHVGGLLARDSSAALDNWLKIGVGMVGAVNGNPNMVGTVIKNTYNAQSSLLTFSSDSEARLRLCRVGDELSFYINEGNGWENPSPTASPSKTQVAGTVDRYDFSDTIQVGVFVDEYSPGKMYAEFDYLRFASVNSVSDCTSESIFDEPPSEPEPYCGDGSVDSGEACDDGNTANGDGCSAQCTIEVAEPEPYCGDSNLDSGEACDDGNTVSGDGCSAQCTIEVVEPEPSCGDGTVDSGEECDDGNTANGDGCSSQCTTEVAAPACGDGTVDLGEQCDDGNTANGDGCSASCVVEVAESTLNDDFSDVSTASDWTIIYPEYSETHGIQDGRLQMVPTAVNRNGWYSTDRGTAYCKQMPEENFAVEVTVDVHSRQNSNNPPQTDWGSAGFVIKPGDAAQWSQDWVMFNIGNQGPGYNQYEGSYPAAVAPEIKSTVDDTSMLRYGEPSSHVQRLRACRVGDQMHFYRKTLDAATWTPVTNPGVYPANDPAVPTNPMYRPDFNGLVNVCLVTNGWGGTLGDVEAFFDDFEVYSVDSVSDCGDVVLPTQSDPVCGDNNLDSGEACDDGNTVSGDGCSAQCTIEVNEQSAPICGDGTVDLGEQCDDGNTANGDGCSSQCSVEVNDEPAPACGDGTVDLGEQCDDGNTVNGDGCSATCTVEAQEPQSFCGDGGVDSGEQCDDGNTVNGDGCSSTCTVEPICGNGAVEAGEMCDDGNVVSNDGCSSECMVDEDTSSLPPEEESDDESGIIDTVIEFIEDLFGLGDDEEEPVEEVEILPIEEEPLQGSDATAFNDEFDGNSLNGWTDMYPHLYQSLSVANGQLTIVPVAQSGWYQNDRGAFVYKLIEGDFVIETQVNAHLTGNENQPPSTGWKAAGFLVRDPASVEASNENWIMYNVGHQGNNGIQADTVGTERKTTFNSQSTLRYSGTGHNARLRVCRIGDEVRMYRMFEGETQWTEEPATQNPGSPNDPDSPVTRTDFPSTLQVGLMTNAWAGSADLTADFDYVRGAVPQSIADCTSETIFSDVEPPVEEEPIETHFRHSMMPMDLNMIYQGAPYVEPSCTSVCLWSDPTSWPSGLPQAGDNVNIPSGTHMMLDVSSPSLGGLTIEGILEFDSQNLELTAEFIMVSGTLAVGTESEPFIHDATITLTDTNVDREVMDMGTRGIMVMGGLLELHGVTPQTLVAQLNAHAQPGDTTITLTDAVEWEVGDEFILLPSDFYGIGGTEQLTVTSVSGNTVSFTPALEYFHWGLLQYPCYSDGVCLTQDPTFSPPMEGGRDVIDERSHVALLSRNIVVQAPDDAVFNSQDFGAHLMVMNHGEDGNAHMGIAAEAYVDGVEFNRVGQAGRLGRYPFHNHIRSYADNEETQDVNDYLRRSTIRHSRNRGIVIHGTNGWTAEENVIYDVRGHAIFFEDAIERRNTVNHNLMAVMRSPEWEDNLKNHEMFGIQNAGPSGVWLSNPDNTVSHNIVADARGHGFWLAFPANPSPGSVHENVNMIPNQLPLLEFDHNTAYSTFRRALMFDNPESDAEGNVFPLQYTVVPDQTQPWGTENQADVVTNYFTAYKVGSQNDPGCIWHRGSFLKAWHYGCYDATGVYFNGAGMDGLVTGSLAVAETLNSETTGLEYLEQNNAYQVELGAFDTYHGTFIIEENVGIGFAVQEPFDEQDDYGFFSTRSAYIRQVDKFFALSLNNVLINSDYGSKVRAAFEYFNLAGALWDPYGEVGAEGNYWVYDVPFLTHRGGCTPVPPEGNGASCPGEFYGVQDFVLPMLSNPAQRNPPYMDWEMELLVERRNDNDYTQTVDTWHTGVAPDQSAAFQHMKGFATQQEGIYVLDFPNYPDNLLTDVEMEVENLLTNDDQFVLAVPYHGSSNVDVYLGTWYGSGDLRLWVAEWLLGEGSSYQQYKVLFNPVNSIQEVLDSNDRVFYHDDSENLVWVNLVGGDLVPFPAELDPLVASQNSPELYNRRQLRVFDVNDV